MLEILLCTLVAFVISAVLTPEIKSTTTWTRAKATATRCPGLGAWRFFLAF